MRGLLKQLSAGIDDLNRTMNLRGALLATPKEPQATTLQPFIEPRLFQQNQESRIKNQEIQRRLFELGKVDIDWIAAR